MKRAFTVGVAVAALAACGGPASRPLPFYSPAAGFTCRVTPGGTGVTIHVPGDGHQARLASVAVRVNAPAGRGRFEHVLGVHGGVVPPDGITLHWAGPTLFGLSRCEITGYRR